MTNIGNMDAELLSSLKEGNRKAFDSLIRIYYPKLMGYVSIMVDKEIARDIVQDVFLYLWENRLKIDFTPRLNSYIFKMCYWRALDHLRSKKILPANDVTASLLLEDELSWLKSNSNDIIKTLSDRDLLRRIEQLIEELPPRRREVFKLSFFHEMSNAEISSLLDMPRRTVESHLYLSLKFLRGKITIPELLRLVLLLTCLH